MVQQYIISRSATIMSIIEDAEKKWSATAALYIRYFEQYTVAVGCNLISSMKIRFSQGPLRVIECGSGAGGAAVELANILFKDPTAGHSLTLVDLSDAMMNYARDRMKGLADSTSILTTVSDATELPFPDCSFDRYLCNMTVHYAPDAEAFLRESVRVLAPGGVAGFSVWGHESLSPGMTLVAEVKRKLGLVDSSVPIARSNFHMGEDDPALRQRVLAAGYKNCSVWHSLCLLEGLSADNYVETMLDGSYSTKQEFLKWPMETQELFRSELTNLAQEHLNRGQPLALDVCYILAQK